MSLPTQCPPHWRASHINNGIAQFDPPTKKMKQQETIAEVDNGARDIGRKGETYESNKKYKA